MDEENPHICDKCFLLFNSKETLTNHQSSCSQSESTNRNCQNIRQLLQNEKIAHSCDLCGKVFTSKGLLISHRMKCREMAPPDPSCNKLEMLDEQAGRKHEIVPNKYDVKMNEEAVDRKPLICDFCFLAFNEEEELRIHKETHSENKQSECDGCGKVFISHSENKQSQCNGCGKVFISHSENKQSQCNGCGKVFILHSENKQSLCDGCGKVFISHSENKQSQCNGCGKVFISHSENKQFQCNGCGKVFISHSENKQSLCDGCGKVFISHHSSQSHRFTCKETKPSVCEMCQVSPNEQCDQIHYKTKEHLNSDQGTVGSVQHESSNDEETVDETSDEKPNVRDKCFKTFSMKENLESHESICAAGEKRYQCCDCRHLVFNSLETFMSHVQTQHGDSRMLTCPVCRLMVPQVEDLQRHMDTHFTGVKDVTSVKFETELYEPEEMIEPTGGEETSVKFEPEPYELEETIKPASGKETAVKFEVEPYKPEETKQNSFLVHLPDQEPHRCGFCDKTFAQETSLKYHRAMHNADKPFKCDLCEKTFSSKGNMIQHQQLHSGKKPHKCDQCDKSFNRKSHLKVCSHVAFLARFFLLR